MNILFFLTPKSMCAYLEDKSTLRQALERMEVAGYAALPIQMCIRDRSLVVHNSIFLSGKSRNIPRFRIRMPIPLQKTAAISYR